MIDIAFLETGVDQSLGQVMHQLRPLVQWRLLVQRNAVRGVNTATPPAELDVTVV